MSQIPVQTASGLPREAVICGVSARVELGATKPLLFLVRAAPVGMNLWSGIWSELAQDFSVVAPNLPVDWVDETGDARELFSRYGRLLASMADELGHRTFHLVGWTGGACIALTMLIEHPDRLGSVVLISPPTRTGEHPRVRTLAMSFVDSITGAGDLEHYTWWWLLSSVSQEFADRHFNALEDIVRRRLEADKGRFHPARVRRWMELQLSDFFHPAELQCNATPVLIVAPAFDGWAPIHTLRRLHARIPNSSFAAVPRGGNLFLWEDPELFFGACGRFLRAAATGRLLSRDPATGPEPESRASRVEDGWAVVFLHGYLMSPGIWSPCVQRLRQAGIACLAPWQPSHGTRVGPPSGWTLRDEARELLEELDRREVRHCVLVGHSMGAMVAIELAALLGERLSGLALVASTDAPFDPAQARELQQSSDFLPLAWTQETAAIYAASLVGTGHLDAHPNWLSVWHEEVRHFDLPGMSNLTRAVVARGDQQETIGRLDAPIWVAHGGADGVIRIDQAQEMARRLGAHLTRYDAAGHCPPLECPSAFTQDCLDFVAQCFQGAKAGTPMQAAWLSALPSPRSP
jgi:pimeloyl-ACP methyl ester carboxylesterase